MKKKIYLPPCSNQVQRKISLISKHKEGAKEEWLNRQEKLKKGVVDEETESIYQTAREAKDLIKHPRNKKVPVMFSTLKSVCTESQKNNSQENSIFESKKSPTRSSRQIGLNTQQSFCEKSQSKTLVLKKV